MLFRPSFRFRIVVLVLGVAIAPLALTGALFLRGAARSGEHLLTQRLELAAEDTREALIRTWIPLRSRLLDVSESWEASAAEQDSCDALRRELLDHDPRIRRAVIRSESAAILCEFDRSAFRPEQGGVPPASSPLMRVRFDMDRTERNPVTIEFGLDGELLLPGAVRPVSAAGMVLALIDPGTGASLLPIPLDASVLTEERFTWGREEWLTTRRRFRDPPLELVLAAPVTPYVAPLRGWVRNWTVLLVAVAVAAALAAVVLTSRMTRSLKALVAGVDAVSAGDLSHRIADLGRDEIARVAREFNEMTASLQRMLKERASRESLAAMGEFAASLAHEIRNPLTALRIDLQSLEERTGDDPAVTESLSRALGEIERLDATVGDALSIVRRADEDRALDISRPIRAAAHSAAPVFEENDARLEVSVERGSARIVGDEFALERLFLNLLLNAAEAVQPGGKATVETTRHEDTVIVRIQDDGPGIPEALRARIFEPLFSTKETGTGLGLTISRRIVAAHRGELHIRDAEGGGTRVEVLLPTTETDTG